MGGKTQTPTGVAENHSVCQRGSAVLIGVAGDSEIAVMVLFDRQRDPNWSRRLQKASDQERTQVIGIRAQIFGELGGSDFGAGVVQRVQRDRR
jgi:hypothetical protein